MKTLGMSAAALSLGNFAQATSSRGNSDRPNIIFILADDLGYGDLGCYGQQKIKTPNIDRMAAEGMLFTQNYAGSTVCAPSRFTLMMGRHIGHARTTGQGQCLMPEDVTVAKLLKGAGYATACIGKWGLGQTGSTGIPNKQGFDYWFGFLNQGRAHFYYPLYVWRNAENFYLEGNQGGKKGGYVHDLFTAEALVFIKDNKDKPFFLYLPYTIPHAELTAPDDSMKQYEGKFEEQAYITSSEKAGGGTRGPDGKGYCSQKTPRAAFAAMVSRMDRDVGRIIDLLKRLGLDENTIVMFSSDNGPHEEGGNDPVFWKSSGPLRGIKRDLYEGGIRVPLVIRWPGKIKAGSASNHICAFWDFLPTCAELAGVKPPGQIDGISMVPALRGQPEKQKKHEFLYWKFKNMQAVRMGDWKAFCLEQKDKTELELYNLEEDIGEKNNIADKHPDVVKKIEKIIRSS